MVDENELSAWEGSTAESEALWQWRGRRLLKEVRRLKARVAELEQQLCPLPENQHG